MERKITILSIDDEENIRFALGELFHFRAGRPAVPQM